MTRARIIAVAGASGGVGASTFTAALAAAASQAGDAPVVCIDGHPLGGGLDVVLGVEHERGIRWPDLARARGSLDGGALVAELPHAGGVGVVAFDRGPTCEIGQEAAEAVVRSVAEHTGVVLLDVPVPGRGGLSELLTLADDAVLLCGSSPSALAAAASATHVVADTGSRWWVAQRGDRGADELAEAVSLALELPLLGVVPDDPRVALELQRGQIPGARHRGRFGTAVRSALDLLLMQNVQLARSA